MTIASKIITLASVSILAILLTNIFEILEIFSKSINLLISFVLIAVIIVLVYNINKTIQEKLKIINRKLSIIESGEYNEIQNPTSTSNDEMSKVISSLYQTIYTLSQVAKQAENIAHGDYTEIIKPKSSKDVLGTALHKMTQSLDDATNIAKDISNGNLNVNAVLRSKDDLLSISMNRMINILKESRESTKDTLWIEEGLKELNTKLNGKLELKELANKALNFVCSYLNTGTGTLYLYEEETKNLLRYASYAYSTKGVHTDTFKLGEGTVGQVALQRSPILLREVKNSEVNIETATNSSSALNSYTLPLIYQGNLQGVLELGTISIISLKEQSFIDQANIIISTAFVTAGQNQHVEQLLSNAQKHNKEMREQQHSLNEQKLALDAHSIVGTTDVKGNITYVNDKFVEISGYSREELIGQNHRLLNSSQHDKAFWKRMYETVSHGKVWNDNNICNIRKDGSLYWVDTTIVPFMKEGKPQSYIAIRTDITESKEIEKELIESNLKAESAVQAKSDFLASMSHEIRTPMNGVIGMLGLLLTTELDTKQQHQVNIAQSSAQSLLSIINDILDFSKLEAGKVELDPTVFDLNAELNNFIEAINVNIKDKDVKLLLDLKKINHSAILADMGRLKQILNNLVGNAIKFTHEGEVVLSASLYTLDQSHGKLKISVEDSGIGIDEDKLATLFDSFTQADTSTTRKYGGTGLGLSIAKNLVEVMGGELRVSSVKDTGTTFSFEIDVKLSQDSVLGSSNIETENQKNINLKFSTTNRILLVEDNYTNQLVAQGILEGLGLHADIAKNGQIALNILENEDAYDLICMDCQMPVLDGFETTEAIRSAQVGKTNQFVPIIAMTANAMQGDKEKCLEVGMTDYISKPIDPQALKLILSKYLKVAQKNEVKYTDIWDKESALSRVMGKEKILINIITAFINENQENIQNIEQALENNDLQSIQNAAHTIKGSSANISALRVNENAKEIEVLAKSSNMSGIEKLFDILKKDAYQLHDILNQYLKDRQ